MSESIAVEQPTKPQPSPTIWRLSDELWQQIQSLIPPPPPTKKVGRPRVDDRRILDGIIYVLRTGCQWKQVSKEFSSGSTVHARFSEWVRAGVFAQMWALLLRDYDQLHGIDWEWQSMDGALGKAPGVPKKGHKTRRSVPTPPTAPSTA
jgi:putative transposase